ncbi:MAG: B12-binding domain-containing protein [Candidatus Hodarchaeota archaeon]
MEAFYKEIIECVVDLDEEKAIALANKAISEGYDILDVIEKGYGKAVMKLGELWNEGEFFLPELVLGGNIVQESIKLLLPHLKSGEVRTTIARVVLATVEGDLHSIGKNIVATMLSANGFEVIDLGVDVPIDKIIDVALEKRAGVIGVSALLTTTMMEQKLLVQRLEEKGIREKFKVVLGGASVTEEWVNECGADGYSGNAVGAVKLINNILGKN